MRRLARQRCSFLERKLRHFRDYYNYILSDAVSDHHSGCDNPSDELALHVAGFLEGIRNLMNAIDAVAESDAPRIGIECRVNEEQVVLAVGDNGPGWTFNIRCGETSIELNPSRIRSDVCSLGAFFRGRFRISSWCFGSWDSAMTVRAPPGITTRIVVTMT